MRNFRDLLAERKIKMSDTEKKTEAALLKEKLAAKKPSGALKLDNETIAKADEFCKGYREFMKTSKVERGAVRTTEKIALENGFVKYEQGRHYAAGDKIYTINRGKNIALAVIGKNGTKNGVHLVIAHIDSPRLDLKPNPVYEANDLAFFKTHYYGGIKKYQWTTIPLALHGRIVRLDGEAIDVCVGEKEGEPKFVVSDLLPHLDRDQAAKPMAKANNNSESTFPSKNGFTILLGMMLMICSV